MPENELNKDQRKNVAELTKCQCESVVDFIECNLFESIRNDLEIDSVQWLCNICDIYRECKRVIDNG